MQYLITKNVKINRPENQENMDLNRSITMIQIADQSVKLFTIKFMETASVDYIIQCLTWSVQPWAWPLGFFHGTKTGPCMQQLIKLEY